MNIDSKVISNLQKCLHDFKFSLIIALSFATDF